MTCAPQTCALFRRHLQPHVCLLLLLHDPARYLLTSLTFQGPNVNWLPASATLQQCKGSSQKHVQASASSPMLTDLEATPSTCANTKAPQAPQTPQAPTHHSH